MFSLARQELFLFGPGNHNRNEQKCCLGYVCPHVLMAGLVVFVGNQGSLEAWKHTRAACVCSSKCGLRGPGAPSARASVGLLPPLWLVVVGGR